MFDQILNDYLKECDNEIEMEILNSLSCEEIKCIYDYGCREAAPGRFLYYYQTNNFFNKYPDECLEMLELAINDYHMIDPQTFEFTRNNIVWVVIEQSVSNFIFYYENNKYRYEEELELEEEDEEDEE